MQLASTLTLKRTFKLWQHFRQLHLRCAARLHCSGCIPLCLCRAPLLAAHVLLTLPGVPPPLSSSLCLPSPPSSRLRLRSSCRWRCSSATAASTLALLWLHLA